jgi:hypothetical protein
MASAREVFPEPTWAIKPTFLNCSLFLSIFIPFQMKFPEAREEAVRGVLRHFARKAFFIN